MMVLLVINSRENVGSIGTNFSKGHPDFSGWPLLLINTL